LSEKNESLTEQTSKPQPPFSLKSISTAILLISALFVAVLKDKKRNPAEGKMPNSVQLYETKVAAHF
jgi:hypothetical protein